MPFADAGLETYLRDRLRWLRLTIRVQIWIGGHRVDALIGDRLVLQIDGAHHVGAQRTEDIRHDAALRLMGYHVIRVSYTQIMFDWATVQDVIMRAVAQGLPALHEPRALAATALPSAGCASLGRIPGFWPRQALLAEAGVIVAGARTCGCHGAARVQWSHEHRSGHHRGALGRTLRRAQRTQLRSARPVEPSGSGPSQPQ